MKFLKLSLLTVFTLLIVDLSAQVEVIDTLTVEELVNDYLLGEGVDATNITFNGEPADLITVAVQLFQGNSEVVDFTEGIIMASGGAGGVLQGGGGGAPENPIQDDPDLVDISGQNINDAAIIEFDFVVSSDSVKFNYVFASNEYPGFTCTGFNDAFGFFLSGPGISGPYLNNAANIALIPNSDVAVAINTVNGGTPTGAGTVENCENANPNWVEDSQYFINNENAAAGDITIPGMTMTFQAEAAVQCGEEYHIKLAIGDALDTALDSYVFLEAGSFSAFGEIFAEFSPVFNEGGDVDQEGYDSLVVAGCTSPEIELIRPSGATFSTIEFVLQGDATEGVDYIVDGDLPQNFPDGEDTVTFSIQTINPSITDTLFFELLIIYETCAGVEDTTFLEIPIAPPPQITTATNAVDVVCPTDSLVIEVTADGGILPYSYDWLDQGGDEDGDAILVGLPEDEEDFIVEVTDRCNFVFVNDTVTVTNSVPPPLEASIDPFADPTCPNEPVDLEGTVLNGNPPYNYVWTDSRGNTYGGFDNITVSDINTVSITFTPTVDVDFMVIDSCGTTVMDSIVINYPIYDSLAVTFGPLIDNCPDGPVELEAETTGGAGDLTYNWAIPEGESTFTSGFTPDTRTTYIDAGSGFNTFTVLVRDRCNRLGQDMIIVTEGGGTELQFTGLDTYEVSIPYINLDPLPNIITPNGDGQNEVFVIPGIDAFEDASMLIYDRWGKLIYENNSYDAGTGEATTSQGFSADGFNDGTYFYIVNIDSGECVTQGNLEVVGGSE